MNNDSRRHISPETKMRIRQAAKEIGYVMPDHPELHAADLMAARNGRNAGKTPEGATAMRQVGCIVSVPQNKYNHPYFSPILEGIEKKLTELGCSLAYLSAMDDIQNEAAIRRMAEERDLKGMLIVEGIRPELYECVKQVVPAVVGIDISDPTVPVISYDRVEAAKSAVRHLVEQGHRRIGFIGGPGLTGELSREKRYRGYQYGMLESNLPVQPEWVVNTGWDVNESYMQASALFDRPEGERPTAMFAASDMMAIAAMRAASEHGLRIPQDVAFVGLDNIEMAQFTTPPLSSVHIPKAEIGIMAAKVLVDEMNGTNPLPFKLMMPYDLIVRQSSEYQRP